MSRCRISKFPPSRQPPENPRTSWDRTSKDCAGRRDAQLHVIAGAWPDEHSRLRRQDLPRTMSRADEAMKVPFRRDVVAFSSCCRGKLIDGDELSAPEAVCSALLPSEPGSPHARSFASAELDPFCPSFMCTGTASHVRGVGADPEGPSCLQAQCGSRHGLCASRLPSRPEQRIGRGRQHLAIGKPPLRACVSVWVHSAGRLLRHGNPDRHRDLLPWQDHEQKSDLPPFGGGNLAPPAGLLLLPPSQS